MYDEYVCADAHIDPAGKDLPALQCKEMTSQVIEMQAMQEQKRRSKCLHEKREQHDINAAIMGEAGKALTEEVSPVPLDKQTSRKTIQTLQHDKDISLADMIFDTPNNTKPNRLGDKVFKQHVKQGYTDDKFL